MKGSQANVSGLVGPLLAALAMLAAPAAAAREPAVKAAQVFLVGDSTMQGGSGYGRALCDLFNEAVDCQNRAVGGRSSKSYRIDGYWDRMIAALSEAGDGPGYVLIQLGHNDGSSLKSRHTALPEYEANMRRFIDEARAAGGIPVLITPVTDRSFSDWQLQDGLRPWADIVKQIAFEKEVILIDLYEQSRAAVQAMGPSQAARLAPAPPPLSVREAAREGRTIWPIEQTGRPQWDHVHLGKQGADLFAAMVADGLRREVPELGRYLTHDE